MITDQQKKDALSSMNKLDNDVVNFAVWFKTYEDILRALLQPAPLDEELKEAIEYIKHSAFTIEASNYLSYKNNLDIVIKAAENSRKRVEPKRFNAQQPMYKAEDDGNDGLKIISEHTVEVK